METGSSYYNGNSYALFNGIDATTRFGYYINNGNGSSVYGFIDN